MGQGERGRQRGGPADDEEEVVDMATVPMMERLLTPDPSGAPRRDVDVGGIGPQAKEELAPGELVHDDPSEHGTSKARPQAPAPAAGPLQLAIGALAMILAVLLGLAALI